MALERDERIKGGRRRLVLLVLVAAWLGFPWLVAGNNYLLSTLIIIGVYALVSTGMTLLMGYAGQISLGQAAFYGVGAYTSAYLTAHAGWPPWLAMAVGAVLAALVAFVVGIPVFRLREHYLALATLGFGVIMFTLFKEWEAITGGLNGFFGIPPISVLGMSLQTDIQFYYLVWLFVLAGLWFAHNIVRSRVGRALRAIHGSEVAASSLGVNITKYKLQIFMLSAMYASVAGSLYAHYVTFINPDLFGIVPSIYFLIMVVIGGTAGVWGGLVGAAVYVCLGEWLKAVVPILMPDAGGEFEIVFFGLLLIIMLIYMPSGLTGAVQKGMKRFRTTAGSQTGTTATTERHEARSIGGGHG
ncbi:branched-chain amino acid ABC transporter permease [Geobacillus sp. 47C-IIb]|jgi:branched-chain amino acid transport system permease protein|uniref:branched-chain amino acid ABC transporter permease n=1 Tax=Geobacillus TaxID=129337 RepID=UPI000555EBA4|nr:MULTISPECIES: branched-chain amino acid ABC transporter permease [Geobacillus]MED3905891.1 branched-chain amino acid ABC transporter permease [Geobacillus thermodenitrificans]OQP09765.1 branched-chain amino acid ABC transporter permease [Geobacillus sp. 47C-IIb]QNU32502.1 branched-chain amino acid ABC transporter permease [Geobacillus sp. 47C-IIb]